MTECERETMELFKKLSFENQGHLLMLTRLAYIAECSVKKSLNLPVNEIAESVIHPIAEKEENG